MCYFGRQMRPEKENNVVCCLFVVRNWKIVGWPRMQNKPTVLFLIPYNTYVYLNHLRLFQNYTSFFFYVTLSIAPPPPPPPPIFPCSFCFSMLFMSSLFWRMRWPLLWVESLNGCTLCFGFQLTEHKRHRTETFCEPLFSTFAFGCYWQHFCWLAGGERTRKRSL